MLRRNDRRSRTIGLLLEDVGNPFSAALHRAVEDEARARGVQVLTGSLDEDPAGSGSWPAPSPQRRADGLIIAPTERRPELPGRRVRNDTPVVFVDRPATGIPGDTVLSTNVGRRHRGGPASDFPRAPRIAYLGDYTRISTARRPHEGYLRGARRCPAWTRSLMVHDLHTLAAAESAVMTVLARPRPADGPVHQPEPDHHRGGPGAAPAAAAPRRRARRLRRLPARRPARAGRHGGGPGPRRDGQTAARALFARIDGGWLVSGVLLAVGGAVPGPWARYPIVIVFVVTEVAAAWFLGRLALSRAGAARTRLWLAAAATALFAAAIMCAGAGVGDPERAQQVARCSRWRRPSAT
jgi:hypothetical protein